MRRAFLTAVLFALAVFAAVFAIALLANWATPDCVTRNREVARDTLADTIYIHRAPVTYCYNR